MRGGEGCTGGGGVGGQCYGWQRLPNPNSSVSPRFDRLLYRGLSVGNHVPFVSPLFVFPAQRRGGPELFAETKQNGKLGLVSNSSRNRARESTVRAYIRTSAFSLRCLLTIAALFSHTKEIRG